MPDQDLRELPSYSIPEAAAFLAIPSRTLSYWFSGRDRVFRPSGDYRSYSLLSFTDISEAYMLYLLRQSHRFSPSEIKTAFENLRKETKSQHPLFELDIKVFAKSLLLDRPPRGKREREVVNLSKHRQLAFGAITDVFSKRILQDDQGQPLRIFPWRFFQEDHDSRPVSIDPEVLSGRLVVTGTRIPVSILVGMRLSKKTPEQIAENYGLDVEAVEKALRHVEKPLQKVT